MEIKSWTYKIVCRENGFVEEFSNSPKGRHLRRSAANNPAKMGPIKQLSDVIWRMTK